MERTNADRPLIYIVDDDEPIAELIAFNLNARDFHARKFGSGQDLLRGLKSGPPPDLIILDVVMPGANGVEVAKEVRHTSRVPIMMISVQDDISTKATALDIGADDYLVKPFEIQELLVRVRAILRRSAPEADGQHQSFYHCGDLSVDLDSSLVTIYNRPVKLTHFEWGVLQVLVRYAGQAVESRFLLREVWGPDYGDEGDYIRAYIARLRRKLEPDPKHPRYILLQRGFGYRMADPG